MVMMLFACLFTTSIWADNVRFEISNMHCQNCANRVEKALKANKAVGEVKVDLACKTVNVSYDAAKTNVEALQKTLTEAKFEAKVAAPCDQKGDCKHKGKAPEHRCSTKTKQQKAGEHKCGGEGCGHDKETK